MSLEMVNINSDSQIKLNNLWLHKYISKESLKHHFIENTFILNLTRIDTLKDGLEGWDYSISGFKEAMRKIVNFQNRVILDNGKYFENLSLLLSMIDVNEATREFLKLNFKERKESYVSCWFASEKISTESRLMWQLYANKQECNKVVSENKLKCKSSIRGCGVMISVKWTDLKRVLKVEKTNYIAGFVNYKNTSEHAMFHKENSYEYEKEFRILRRDYLNNNYLGPEYKSIKLKSKFPITCKIWSFETCTELKREIERLGFKSNEVNNNWVYKKSELLPEFLK